MLETVGVLVSIPLICWVGLDCDKEGVLLLTVMALLRSSGALRFGTGHWAVGETSFLAPSSTAVLFTYLRAKNVYSLGVVDNLLADPKN